MGRTIRLPLLPSGGTRVGSGRSRRRSIATARIVPGSAPGGPAKIGGVAASRIFQAGTSAFPFNGTMQLASLFGDEKRQRNREAVWFGRYAPDGA
jgi:hypothetical protein